MAATPDEAEVNGGLDLPAVMAYADAAAGRSRKWRFAGGRFHDLDEAGERDSVRQDVCNVYRKVRVGSPNEASLLRVMVSKRSFLLADREAMGLS